MLKKLILAAGVALVGVFIHKIFKSKASEDLVDDACETMHDILNEECCLNIKEKIIDKVQDVKYSVHEIINGLSNPDIYGDGIRNASMLLEDSYRETFINNQFKYNALYRNFMTAGRFSIIFSLAFFLIGLKFREIGNAVYERDLAINSEVGGRC